MDDFTSSIMREEGSGIPVNAWITFLKIFGDNTRDMDVVESVLVRALRGFSQNNDDGREKLIDLFEQALVVLRNEPAGDKPAGKRRTLAVLAEDVAAPTLP